MTKTEAVVRFIMGPGGGDIRPLVYAVDIAIDLLFRQRIAMDDIQVTKSVYPNSAKHILAKLDKHPTVGTATRRIQRLSHKCWDAMVDRDLVETYIGIPLKRLGAPREIIVYLAFYTYCDQPFYTVIQQNPAILF